MSKVSGLRPQNSGLRSQDLVLGCFWGVLGTLCVSLDVFIRFLIYYKDALLGPIPLRALLGPMNIYTRTLHGCSEPNGEPVWTAVHIRHAKIYT